MSEPTAGDAGPGASGPSRTDAALLRQFVMEYLQSHGFDKALETFKLGIAAQDGSSKDGEGASGEGAAATATGAAASGAAAGAGVKREPAGTAAAAAAAANREAIFRAPGPVSIESTLKRNIPQAQAVSASAMSERISPEFEAQAKYIIEQLQKRMEAAQAQQDKEDEDGDGPAGAGANAATAGDSMIDSSERIDGYKRYRRWVDNGLDLWKAELDGLSFPIFANTFLDLIHYGFNKSARMFFNQYREHHEALHSQAVAALAGVTSRNQLGQNMYCQRLLSEKYCVAMSRNAHDLLIQWLSGAGPDEEWDSGLRTAAGRAKEAVKAIIYGRINVTVADQPTPLDSLTLATSSGLLASIVPGKQSLQDFNASTPLKLGPVPMAQKLKDQIAHELRDEAGGSASAATDAQQTADGSSPHGQPNGGSTNGVDGSVDVEMAASPAAGPSGARAPPAPGVPSAEPGLDAKDLVAGAQETAELVSPAPEETNPPTPALFRIVDLKREVEAIRDKRKMIRLGPGMDENAAGGPSVVLPSVVAFTVFDQGEGVSSVEFSPDASLMAAASPESCIRLWSLKGEKLKAKSIDPETGGLTEDEGLAVRKLIGHSGPVYSLSFDPLAGSAGPPSSLLSSSQDGTIRLWSMDTYTNLVAYRGHGRDPVWDVEWGPMGVYFASASRDRTARLWTSDRVVPLRMYTGHLSDVNCVKFHPNSLYLATGSNDNSCRLWDVQRGACIRLFLGHTDAVTCMAISPDGRTLASAGLDSSIWLWDLGSSRPIKTMKGHRGPIHTLSWSAESSVLVSGGADCTVRCWDVKSAGGARRGSALGGSGGGGAGATGGAGGGAGGITGVAAGLLSGGVSGSDASRGELLSGTERGSLPMGPGEMQWDEQNATADLLSTFRTKRTPILSAHYTPRNLCMVAGLFAPPSSTPAPAA